MSLELDSMEIPELPLNSLEIVDKSKLISIVFHERPITDFKFNQVIYYLHLLNIIQPL